MSFSEFEIKRFEKEISEFMDKRRPPVHIRNEVDLGFRLDGQSVEIFEIRAVWNNPEKKMEEPVAKATYVKRKNLWKVYWMKSDLKWHKYEPEFEVNELADFVAVVDEDRYACFWG
jgi:spore coat polysaccharide biosynthesis protein SpsF (cytidylyltransferase family)